MKTDNLGAVKFSMCLFLAFLEGNLKKKKKNGNATICSDFVNSQDKKVFE